MKLLSRDLKIQMNYKFITEMSNNNKQQQTLPFNKQQQTGGGTQPTLPQFNTIQQSSTIEEGRRGTQPQIHSFNATQPLPFDTTQQSSTIEEGRRRTQPQIPSFNTTQPLPSVEGGRTQPPLITSQSSLLGEVRKPKGSTNKDKEEKKPEKSTKKSRRSKAKVLVEEKKSKKKETQQPPLPLSLMNEGGTGTQEQQVSSLVGGGRTQMQQPAPINPQTAGEGATSGTSQKQHRIAKERRKSMRMQQGLVNEPPLTPVPKPQKSRLEEQKRRMPSRPRTMTASQKSFMRSMCHVDFVARNHYVQPPEERPVMMVVNDEFNQVRHVMNGREIRELIPFSFDEFEIIVESVKYVKRVGKDNYHLVNVHERKLFLPLQHLKVKMTLQLMIFILIYFLHKNVDMITLYYEMDLKVFGEKNKIEDKRRFASYVVEQCVHSFVGPLYDSLIESRRIIEIERRVPLSAGRPDLMKHIIPELEKTYFIVDGVNMNIAKKRDNENKLRKEFYNPKSKGSGMKYLIFQDVFGYCANMTDSVPASIHDAVLYKMEMDKNMIPKETYCMGDGGFRGMDRCITPFPRKCKETLTENTFITEEDKMVYYTGSLLLSEGISIEVTIQCVCGYYGLIEEKNGEYVFDGSCRGTGQQIRIENDSHIVRMKEDEIKSLYDNYNYVFKCTGKIGINELKRNEMDKYELYDTEVDGYIQNDNCCLKFDGKIDMKYGNDRICGINASTTAIKLYNSCLSSIRIQVENFFGRRNVLFKICTDQYHLSMNLFNDICKITCALTNAHLQFHPLRDYPFYLFSNGVCKQLNCNPKLVKEIPLSKKATEILKTYCDRSDVKFVGNVVSYLSNVGRPSDNTTLEVPNVNLYVSIDNENDNSNKAMTDKEYNDIKNMDFEALERNIETKIDIKDSSALFDTINEKQDNENDIISTIKPITYQCKRSEIKNNNDSILNTNVNNSIINEANNDTTQTVIGSVCNNNMINKTAIDMNDDMNDDMFEISKERYINELGMEEDGNLDDLEVSRFKKADCNYIDDWVDEFSKQIETNIRICKTSAYQILCGTNVNVFGEDNAKEENSRLFERYVSCIEIDRIPYDYIFIPCLFREHWLLIMWDVALNAFLVFNSLERYYSTRAAKVVTDYMSTILRIKEIRTTHVSVLQQKDKCSCGYRMLHNLYMLTVKKLYTQTYKLMYVEEKEFEEFVKDVLKYKFDEETNKMEMCQDAKDNACQSLN